MNDDNEQLPPALQAMKELAASDPEGHAVIHVNPDGSKTYSSLDNLAAYVVARMNWEKYGRK